MMLIMVHLFSIARSQGALHPPSQLWGGSLCPLCPDQWVGFFCIYCVIHIYIVMYNCYMFVHIKLHRNVHTACTIMYIMYHIYYVSYILYNILYIICSHLQPIVNLLQFNQSGSTLETLHSDWRWKNRPWCPALSPSTGMACFYKSILSKVLLSLRWSCVHCVKLSIVLLLSCPFVLWPGSEAWNNPMDRPQRLLVLEQGCNCQGRRYAGRKKYLEREKVMWKYKKDDLHKGKKKRRLTPRTKPSEMEVST